MRTFMLLLLLCFASLVGHAFLWAESSSCEIPLVVTRFAPATGGNELVTDLAAGDLSVKVGESRAMAKGISLDDSGKRIALILDASKKVPNEEWKLEVQMALSLLDHARSADKFSLSLVGASNSVSSFAATADLQAQLRDMASSRPEAFEDNERIYDALLEAARRFDPPQFGDTIFLFGHPDDSGSQATLEQAQEMILRNRLRVYGLSFTNPLAERLPKNFDLNKPLPKNSILPGADDIAHATGYFVSYHQPEVLRRFPDQVKLLQGLLGDLYAGIAQPYKLEISPSPSARAPLELKILNGQGRNINQNDVHYPKFIYSWLPK